MAINFPDNPTPNDTFTDGGRTWIWDGTTWKIYSSTTSGILLGDLSVNTNPSGTSSLSYNSNNGVFTYTPPDLSGYLTQQYTLPTASTTVLGGVKVDGSTITINGSGVISGASTYNDGDVDARLNTATASSGKIVRMEMALMADGFADALRMVCGRLTDGLLHTSCDLPTS